MSNTFSDLVQAIKAGEHNPHSAAEQIYELLSEPERLWLLDGDVSPGKLAGDFLRGMYNHAPYRAAEISRLGIPGIRFADGPRGSLLGMGESTAFPCSSTRAASWNAELERQVVSPDRCQARGTTE